jgi:hypothetical protein
VDNILSDDAANLVGAITASGQGSSVGVTATQSGAGVTISASAAGSSGNAITLTNNLSNITLASPLAGGGNGTDSATTFAYWSGTTYDSQTQLATDIATALGDNSTITGAFTIDSVNSPAGDIVISYTAPGTAGNGQTLTTSSFSALTGGTFSGGTAAGLGAGQYPAKYGFSATTASCSDYVIYPTGATGSTSQATIVAYTNLYGSSSTGCGASPGGAVPEVYWAYNTPVTVSSTSYYGVATLSPVINWSGTQVAFVESVTVSGTTTAYLVLLRMTNSGSAVTTATSETAAQYYNSGSGCAAPCYTTFSLATTDTNSPPFYDYAHDAIYVGDDLGKVHQFTTVFNGTPTVGSGFPVQVSTETSKQLTGPVVDPSSALIFVSDNSGYLHSITSSGGNLLTSGQMDYNGGFTDAPLVDTASTAYVYTFGQHSTATYINAFATSSSINGSTGTAKQIGSYASTSLPVYDGAFDNQHSAYNNGHLYFCALSSSSSAAYPTLYQIAMGSSGLSNSTVTLWNTLTNGNATCSPVTEFYNSPTDYAYVSVTANGSNTDCTGACLYNFSLPTTGNGTAGAATAGLAVADGASGVIIDNNVASGTLAGASQIYFSSLGSETCSTSGGTGACAVQASQSNPSGPDYGTGSVTVNATDLGLTDGDTVTIGPTGSTIIYTAQADGNLCGSGPCFWDGGTTDTYAAESLYAAITNNPGNCPTANEGSHWTNTCFTNVTAANPYVSATWAGVTINLTNSLGSNLIFTTNNTSDITLVPNTGVLP